MALLLREGGKERDREKGRDEKEKADRSPTIFGLKVALHCMINEVLLLTLTDCRTKS